MRTNTFDALVGLFGVVGMILVLFLAALWILFPFVVWRQLGELHDEAQKQTALLEQIANQTARPDAQKPKESAARYRIPGINS
jgi:hypothetical protein